jgi:hypothetical protein
LFGILENGGLWSWSNDGGHASGRKWPILFAGLVLNDEEMKNIGQKSGDYLYAGGYGPGNCPPDYIHFGEDDQTFYVAQYDVDITNSAQWSPDSRDAAKIPYTTDDIGLPEWGIRHATGPNVSNAYWGTTYRQCCTAIAWAGFTLAARLMEAKALWNHDALFDYVDRYMATEKDWRQWSALAIRMWDTYRVNYDCVWVRSDTTDALSSGGLDCSRCVHNCPAAIDPQEQTISGVRITDNQIIIAPNPVEGALTITLSRSSLIEVYTSAGSWVKKALAPAPSMVIQTGDLKPGIYLLHITQNGKKWTQKFLVARRH